VKIWDVVNRDDFDYSMNEGYLRIQRHPEFPSLCIANYTESAVFNREWNSATTNCRGLIWDEDTEELYSRPLPKFFNYGEVCAPVIPLDAEVWATDKIDGSLGILYRRPDGQFAVATRGSFASEQAQHATQLLHSKYSGWVSFMDHFRVDTTYLFEIVYPENRIVCDYGDMDALVLLGSMDFNGRYHHPNELFWDGPRTNSFEFENLSQALAAAPRPGAEGMVLYIPELHDWVKLKQDDYVELHRIVSNLNAKVVWESLRNGTSVEEICDPLPDEFHDWVREVADQLGNEFDRILFESNGGFSLAKRSLEDLEPETNYRKEFAHIAKTHKYPHLLFKLLDGKSIDGDIWKMIEPKADWTP
jgi:RNA ligase